MPVTPVFGLPFEAPDDVPGITLTGGPAGTNPILAEQVEQALLDQAASFQTQIDALQAQVTIGAPAISVQSATINGFSNTSFEPGSPICGFPFTAPPSGRMLFFISASFEVNDLNGPTVRFTLRLGTGATLNTGTAQEVNNTTSPNVTGALGQGDVASDQTIEATSVYYSTAGLTPGATYNAVMVHAVTSGTADVFERMIIGVPLL